MRTEDFRQFDLRLQEVAAKMGKDRDLLVVELDDMRRAEGMEDPFLHALAEGTKPFVQPVRDTAPSGDADDDLDEI